ncbi:TPA: hypothetical protein JAN90_04475 [Legionella pneumophila]|nr:hypothetical protein [Legionella pneumophila]HAT8869206.1 hypothetical protein [Legionella pneumophila subsp. pneumophila]HAT7072031.1 hypothetical protein [Legionella pneumophila]HAT8642967.1 hypothetical protein [Legionella pneumophila]HAT8891294.1 hypothetical protein [Legionella pneumophila subsp. pneumophila]HAT8932210.1 hypothetical protein [Legionella pneumophila subsp. pneumophila]
MSDQAIWEQKVNYFKYMHKFNSKFDLVRDFRELHLWPERQDLLRSELKQKLKELNELKKEAKKETSALEKALKLPIHNQEVITVINKAIQEYSEAISRNIFIPQKYSKPMMYISRLCAIFYKGTGIFPEVVAPKVKGKSPYRGNFYEFILGAKPLLAEIGTELIANDETIGKDAWMIVNGVKEKKILSFVELQKEIELENKEIAEIKKLMYCT